MMPNTKEQLINRMKDFRDLMRYRMRREKLKIRFERPGNYGYVCARVKARKPLLFTKEIYARLLEMDVPSIARFVGDTIYKDAITELALHYKGAELIERAMNKGFAAECQQILGYCKGSLKKMLSAYLKKWDVHNLKALMRGKLYQAAEDEITKTFIVAGSYPESFWQRLVAVKNFDSLLEYLKGTEFYNVLQPVRKKYEVVTDLFEFENALDIYYYTTLVESVVPFSDANKLFLKYIKNEIDTVNLKTLFAAKYENVDKDKILKSLILIGYEFNRKDLEQLALAADFTAFLKMLESYPIYSAIQKEVAEIELHKSLVYVFNALEKYLISQAKRFSYLQPVSIIPVLDYFLRKKKELDNTRIIAYGKQEGLRKNLIEQLVSV